jgi:hypothetical protein
MEIDIPHSLGRDEAKRRIAVGLPKLAAHIPGGGALQSEWTGDYALALTISAMGQVVPVALEIEDDRLSGTVEIPAFLKMMAGQVAQFVKTSAVKMLDKA